MTYGKRIMSVCLTVIMLMSLLMLGSVMSVSACAENSKVEEAQNSVVRIFVNLPGGISIGSGFAVGGKDEDVDTIITNYHVIADNPDEIYVTVTDINGGIPAEMIYSDEDNDFAILRLDEKLTDRKPIALLSPKELHKSQSIYCIGFPGLSDTLSDSDTFSSRIKDMTITNGTVSNNEYTDYKGTVCILSDVKVNRGNSGGPMVDEYGQAVGINTMVIGGGVELNNMTLAVSIDYVTEVLEDKGINYIKGTANGANQKNSDAGDSVFDNINIDDALPYIIAAAVVIVAAVTVLVVAVAVKKRKKVTVSASVGHAGKGDTPGHNPAAETVSRKLVVTCERGPIKGQSVGSFSSVRIGRNKNTCQLVYPDNTPGVSKEHCELYLTAGGIIIQDLNSTYGTFLSDGQKLAPGERKNIGNENIVLLGSDKVIISVKTEY